jgi:crotonobetainyl-CoA:carnitine CoA-transferase CaiB-like acyl-CoA transferase
MKHADADAVPAPPGPAFGDSIGAMTIAGGIMGALFHRERTGEGSVVDVSLLGVGLWSHGAALALSLQLQRPWAPMPRAFSTGNPLVNTYRTKDDRYLSICCLQAGKYWPGICEVIGQPELASDERFAEPMSLMKNGAAATQILAAAFAERAAAEWRERLAGFSGQWAMVQDTLEASVDPQTVANGYVVDCRTSDGTPFQLAAAPVQYDEKPAIPGRAPEFNEHGDAILGELGFDMDAILDLKVRGVVA